MNNGTNNDASKAIPKCGNPYKTLNLPNFATSAQIKKKFRELSLKVHPDKRKPNLTQKEHDELDKEFQNVQEAKSFLLDAEFSKAKEKYDLKLKSDGLREEREKKREEQMDVRRKGMRNDLQSKIEREMAKKHGKFNSTSHESQEDRHMEGLQKAGKRMRESYYDKKQAEEERHATRERKRQKNDLQYRQISLKWSRAKVGKSYSEHSIVQLLSDQFGDVEHVELIGRKGNTALVTFVNASSCKPCVDKYLKSDKMRATFVGKRKDEEDNTDKDIDSSIPILKRGERDRESVEERKLRQAAERERLLRQMENDNETNDTEDTSKPNENSYKSQKTSKLGTKPKSLFPPHFPQSNDDNVVKRLTAFERLEQMEREILKDIVDPDVLWEKLRIRI